MRPGLRALIFALTILLVPLTRSAAGDERSVKSPYAGTYSGRFTCKSAAPGFTNGDGKVTLTIAADGKVTGKFIDLTANQPGDFTGSIDEEGSLKYTIEFSDVTYVVKGTATKTKKGHLKATLTQYSGKEAVGNVEFDLPPK